MKRSLKAELARRKFKITSRIIYLVYYTIMGKIYMKKYKSHITIQDDIRKCKGPCFLIWNHLSRQDHGYCMAASYPRRLSIVAGYNEFFRSHLHFAFKLANIIPKKNYTTDINSVKGIQRMINKGGTVCFAPEGMSSIYGTNQPVVVGTGRFLKHFKIPVYFLELRGQYLTTNKVCLDERFGNTYATMKLFFTPEDLQKLSPEEIEDKINVAFRHDDYKWNKVQRNTYESHGTITKNLDEICYKCPKCGTEFEMSAHDDVIECKHCGNGAHMNDMYDFLPFNKDCVLPDTPSDWVANERIDVIKEIRKDPNYFFEEKVKLGWIPDDHYIANKETSEICGEGVFRIDHQGVHFKGTKFNEPFSFDQDYNVVFSLVIVTCPDRFALYYNGEFYEFHPERNVVGKMLLLTEEMHRLHVNTWKNFPWNDYMYKQKNESK